jgi:hypothetical protein
VSASAFSFEHFYHGQLFQGGRLQGDYRLLASSSGIKSDHVAQALLEAPIPPLEGKGAWALVRGVNIPFLLVQSQPGMRHYIFITVDALRALGGNLKAMLAMVEPQIRTFETTGNSIPTIKMPNLGFPSTGAQENAMLDLMTATRDRPDVIEALLAAIIHGVQIVVQGAPPELEKRVAFVEGLLALLPPPARFGVTFTTNSTSDTQLDAQICFYGDDDVPPENTLSYQWGARSVGGKAVEDEYARFIKSQLRLDTGLVIDQTTALTPVAGWRIRSGASLAEALKYGSYRLKIDNAVLNHQPVEADEVAKILGEDPTLSDELRVAYIRHLLAFALALDESANTDLLAVIARGQPDLERAILNEMNAALHEGKAGAIYHRVMRWRSRPNGFRGMYWEEIAQNAAVAYAEMLAQGGDPDALSQFMNELREVMNPVEITAIAPRLIEVMLPLAAQHRQLAETVFVLAATSMPTERWQRIVMARPLLAQLPAGVAQLMAYISQHDHNTPPPGLLAQVISDFEPQWRPLLFIRLTELIILAGRFDLLDPPALEGLAEAAATPWATAHDVTLRWIVRNLDGEDVIQTLNPGCRLPLLQILLARRAYSDLANDLLLQGRLFYPADKQMQFGQMVYSLIAESDLPVQEIAPALTVLAEKGVKPLPLAMAHFGALHRHRWSNALEKVAADVSWLVFNNRLIAESMSPELIIELLGYHIQKQDANLALRVASLLPVAAARRGEDGISIMIQMYRMMNRNEEGGQAALDGLRRYIRRCSDSFVPHALVRLGRELGEPVQRALEATVTLYQIMGGEDIGDYAYSVHTASEFLYDTFQPYMDKNNMPSINSLISDLSSLSGGLSNDERRALSEAILEFGRLLSALAIQHRQVHPREQDEHIEGLLTGKGTASTVFDVFRVMGGYFSRARRLSIRAERGGSQHPLSDRAAHVLLREIEQINRLLKTALRAIPSDRRIHLSAAALQEEIESLWGDISLHERRTLVRDLAIDLQRIPEITLMITERADVKVLQDDSGIGRKLESANRRPENALEFYRFVHGYFKARTR